MAKLDKTEKTVLGAIGSIGCLALLFALTVFGLGIWGFVELILWITSK